jgi:single-strand DNA-binding protein
MSTNNVNLVGNLTEDPTLRYTSTGKPVTNMRLAVNERIAINGEWHDRTTFMNVVCWGDLAENAAYTLRKAMRIQAQGRIQIREYQPDDTDPTSKSYFTELVASEVGLSLKFHVANEVEKSVPSRTVPA